MRKLIPSEGSIASRGPVPVRVLLYLLFIMLIIMGGCERSAKTFRLRFKFSPGTKLVYERHDRHSSQAFQADSLVRQQASETAAIHSETTDSVLGDTMAYVFAHDLTRTLSFVVNDTVVIDTVPREMEYIYASLPSGRIVHLVPVTNFPMHEVDYFKQLLQQSAPEFPTTDLHQGFTWTQTNQIIINQEIRRSSATYVVRSFVREQGYDCAVIDFEYLSIIPFEIVNDSTQTSGVDELSRRGTLYFAYREGFTVSERNSSVANGTRRVRRILPNGELDSAGRDYTVIVEGDYQYWLKETVLGTSH